MTIPRNLSFLAQGASSTGVLGTANGGTNLTSFTVNAIPYASSSSVLTTSSALVFDGTNLGIGTSIPSSFGKLAVNTAALGSGQADGINLAVNGALRGGLIGTGTTFSYAGTAANSLWLYSASNPLYLGPDGATYVAVITNGAERARVYASGGVSIGNTTDPGASNLSVTGSASAASFIPTSSTVPTNGMYLPAANTVGISTASTERCRIDASGNVLVGGTSNAANCRILAENNTGQQLGARYTGIATYYLSVDGSGNCNLNRDGTIFTQWFASGGVSIGNTTDKGAASLNVSGLIFPQQAATASAPAYVKGAIYFDTTLNKLRVGGATAWETITSI